MTKRILSAILACMMVMSFFTGLTDTVSAEQTDGKTNLILLDDVRLPVCEAVGLDPASETEPDVYTLASYIRDGDRILFVWPDAAAPQAAGPRPEGANYLSTVDAVLADGELTAPHAVAFEVEARPAGTFAFKHNGLYLAPGNAADGDGAISLNEEPADWIVFCDDDISIVLSPINDEQAFFFQYSPAAYRFSAYLSRQEDIAIYKLKTAEDLVDVYFVDEDDNDSAYACCFSSSSGEAPACPGTELTACGVEKDGHRFYRITVDRNQYDRVIFSGGSSETQTAELDLGTGGNLVYYIQSGAATVGSDLWPAPGTVVAPTCTEPGFTRYTGLLTGVPMNTDPVVALGHAYGAWSGNGDHTRTRVCANDASHTETEFCTDSNRDGVCDVCGGALNASVRLPDYGDFVIAARVGDQYYALPAVFDVDNPNGTEVTAVDGWMQENDAQGFIYHLEALGDGSYRISNGTDCLGYSGSGSELQKVNAVQQLNNCFRWRITAGKAGSYRVANCAAPGRALACQDQTAAGSSTVQTCFGVFAASDLNAGADGWFDLELLPVERDAESDSPEDIDVYFVDETDGNQAYAYYYDENANEDESGEDLQYPSVRLTAMGEEKDGHPYSKITLNTGRYTDVVFHNGQAGGASGANQTADLPFAADARQDPLNPAGNRFVVYYIYDDHGVMCAATGNDVWPKPAERQEPTCTEPGWSRYVGLRTGVYADETVLPAAGHTPLPPAEENRVEPTCTEPGSHDLVVRCAVCGMEQSREHEAIGALGHDWSEWETEYEPTCIDKGEEFRICNRCHVMEQRDVDELGHDPSQPVQENYNAPTCVAAGGYDTVVRCNRCQRVLAYVHTVLNALGHDWGEWKTDHAPTCTDRGVDYRICNRCHVMEQRDVDELGHDPSQPVQENYNAPTCISEGGYDTVIRCSRCQQILSSTHTVLNALGHDWGEWQTDHAPTCTDRGVDYRICYRCHVMEQRDVDELGHNPGAPVQENYLEPTATTEGGYDTVVYCTRCSAELSREHTTRPATGPNEPVLDENLTLYASISVGVEMQTTLGVRRTQVQNYESWYIEVCKLDADSHVTETRRFGPGQEGAVEDGYIINAVYTDITAKEMGVTYTATLHCFKADGSEVYSKTAVNTLRDYLIGEFTNADNPDAIRTLSADMLNYGAAAQVYFEYDVAHLVNQNLSADAAAAKAQYETPTEAPADLVNSENGPTLYGSVSIMNRVVLGLTARNLNTAGTVQIRVKDHDTGSTKATLETTKRGSVYTADYEQIEAEDIRTAFDFVTLVDGVETGNTLTWSVEGYVRAGRENENVSGAELALLNALLIYADSAAAANFNPSN